MDYKSIFKEIKRQFKCTGDYDYISIDSRGRTIYLENKKGYCNMKSFFKNFDYQPNGHVIINNMDFIITCTAYTDGVFKQVFIKEYNQFLKDGR